MSPVRRALSGDVLTFDLGDEMQSVRDGMAGTRTRIARTIVKEGPLRLTLIGLKAGGKLHAHEAEGPITIHVMEGELLLDAGGTTRTLPVGAVAALDGGVMHSATAPGGAVFLLTVAAEGRAGRAPVATRGKKKG